MFLVAARSTSEPEFCLQDLNDGTGSLTHQTHVPEELAFPKTFPCPVGMPVTLLPEASLAEGVSCSTGNPAADSAFQSFCQQHCPLDQKITGKGELSYFGG